ncbi:PDZ domain-containing protein [Luteolibacter flavescens]|uniref:PDZ domain-containing protein n=1 Tax=Luteolibacter flavescens TaxID=1859460 RepID=A0ABT3FQK2_9BACT|nr:PDZ domain-containing protein [Luteolibacter flavescens]MCW1885845.1 PDZ domain-containing protein [Luteolibacter flavescens]
MRPHLLLPLLLLAACDRSGTAIGTASAAPEVPATATPPAPTPGPVPVVNPESILPSVVRINTTQQSWSQAEPWQKNSPGKRRSLGALVGEGLVLTTAEMAADATLIEFESPDGKRIATAKVVAVDYEANLALLGLASQDDAKFFNGTKALEIAATPKPGDTLDILQVEENGTPLITSGGIQSIDVVSNFLPGQFFLTYEVKASMQSAASSFSLPVLREGKLAGILTSYDSKDQLSDVTATDIVARFVKEGADGDYAGFPSLGISISRTEDPNFRLYLKLAEDGGGLYVSTVRPGGAADKAGLKKGDVILSIDGNEIDRLGYFDDAHYGRLYWSHLVRGAKASGDKVDLSIIRDGQPMQLSAVLDRRDEVSQLVPAYAFGTAPSFLVKGGLVFQELTRPLLESFGSEWQTRAPLNLLDVVENPEKYESRGRRIVFLSNVIPTPATVGYEPLQSMIVTKVNGQDIKDMKTLIEAFKAPAADGLHAIEFDEEKIRVYLDESASDAVDQQLLQRGLPRLSRAED